MLVLNAWYALQLWAGAVNFPDFFAQQTIDWWTSQIQNLYSQLPLDGLWIDMHEPSNFCSGDVCTLPGDCSESLPVTRCLECKSGIFHCYLACGWTCMSPANSAA